MSGEDQEEQARYWASIEVPIEPIKQLKTHLFREKCTPRVKEILAKHSCVLEIKEDHCLVTFPTGTTRQEILPRPNYSVCSRIQLPDGYEMREVIQRGSLLGALGFPDQDFSDC